MKKRISLMLCSIMLLTILVVPVNAQGHECLSQNDSGKAQSTDDLTKDEASVADFRSAMTEQYGEDYFVKLERNELATKNANIIESKFAKDKSGDVIYPDYIGGLYIDSNNNLTIQVVKKNIPNSRNETYQSIINVDKNSKVEYVNYSYEELNGVHDIILNNFLGKFDNLTGLYVDVISNRVVVELKEFTNEKIEEFKNKVINSPMISFDKATVFEQISSASPGGSFISAEGYQQCSYGYRAKLSTGQTGIVSAAHCFNSGGDSIPGIGMLRSYQNTGELDAAFVINTSGANLSNLIIVPNIGITITLSANVNASPIAGQSISKYGRTTGLTSGTITATNYSYTNDKTHITYTKQVKAIMDSTNGDSGGPAFQLSASNSSNATIVGILSASSTDRTKSIITKASLINQHFALSTY